MSLTNLGFDVSPSLGLVSAATEDSQVLLFDLWTGKELVSDPRLYQKQLDRVTSLKFIDDNDSMLDAVAHGRLASLLVGRGEMVEKWKW